MKILREFENKVVVSVKANEVHPLELAWSNYIKRAIVPTSVSAGDAVFDNPVSIEAHGLGV